MNTIASKINTSILDDQIDMWWPGLIAAIFRSHPYNKLLDNYSTAATISGGTIYPLAVIPISTHPTVRIEYLNEAHFNFFCKHTKGQLSFAEASSPTVINQISRSFELIKVLPTLEEVVLTLVKSIHVIQADSGFDVSFTDPGLPLSIFVSIPINEKFSDLRLAESIIHEAMHLQLAAVEKEQPLILNDLPKLYSPWKKMLRPISGIMHALYVFSVIKQWLEAIKEIPTASDYAESRLTDISSELRSLDHRACYSALTPSGVAFFDNMIKSLKS